MDSTSDDSYWLYGVFLPQGRLLTPQQILDIIRSDEDASAHEGRPVAICRRRDGRAYALGLREERPVWQKGGYQIAGTVPLLRELMALAERTGIRDDSLVWYLLTDVEKAHVEERSS